MTGYIRRHWLNIEQAGGAIRSRACIAAGARLIPGHIDKAPASVCDSKRNRRLSERIAGPVSDSYYQRHRDHCSRAALLAITTYDRDNWRRAVEEIDWT